MIYFIILIGLYFIFATLAMYRFSGPDKDRDISWNRKEPVIWYSGISIFCFILAILIAASLLLT